MQTRQPNLEGTGEIRLRRLVKEALRMRPDRLLGGQIEGCETSAPPGPFSALPAPRRALLLAGTLAARRLGAVHSCLASPRTRPARSAGRFVAGLGAGCSLVAGASRVFGITGRRDGVSGRELAGWW